MANSSPSPAPESERPALSLDALVAVFPPGWRTPAHLLYGAALGCSVSLLSASILDGALHVEHTATQVKPPTRRWFEASLAACVQLSTETCALCGVTPAPYTVDAPIAPAVHVCFECDCDLATEKWDALDTEWRQVPDVADLLVTKEGARGGSPEGPSAEGSAKVPSPVAERLVKKALAPPMASDLDVPLPPERLRELWGRLVASMGRRVAGNHDVVRRLALVGALHVGSAPEVAARLLVLGRSGAGKTHVLRSLIDSLAEAGYPLPVAWADTSGLTSPGWGKALSIGEMILAALGPRDVLEPASRRCVVVLDEIHHARITGDDDSNIRAKREEVLASLLSLVGGDRVPLGERTDVWSARQALVIACGAFTGLGVTAGNVTPSRLAAVGIQAELANRLCAGDILEVTSPPRSELARVLGDWPELLSLRSAARRLGFDIAVPEATLYRAASLILDSHHGDTMRSAGGALVRAARQHLIAALEHGSETEELIVAPDDLRTPRALAHAGDPRRDPPDEQRAFS